MPYGQALHWWERVQNQSAWVFLAGLMIISAIGILFDPSTVAPPSLYQALDQWMVYGWAGSMLFASGCILAGIFTGKAAIERIGHAWLLLAMGVWVTCILSVNFAANRATSMIVYGIFMFAVVARYRALGKAVHIKIPRRLQ